MEASFLMTMRHRTAIVGMTAVLLAAGPASSRANEATASTSPAAAERPAHFVLTDASQSIDALIARLLDALAKSDAQALNRLRVTEQEYRSFFLPGASEPGSPARTYDDASSTFAWQMLETKNAYTAAAIMKGYGGHTYRVKEVTYLKGRKEYAWYTAYRTMSLRLEDENGKTAELVLGSVADVDGQFKFVSLKGNS